jgi:hypothetical protein
MHVSAADVPIRSILERPKQSQRKETLPQNSSVLDRSRFCKHAERQCPQSVSINRGYVCRVVSQSEGRSSLRLCSQNTHLAKIKEPSQLTLLTPLKTHP